MTLRELLQDYQDNWFIVVLSSLGNLIYFGYHPEAMKRAFLCGVVSGYAEIQKDNIKELEVVLKIDY